MRCCRLLGDFALGFVGGVIDFGLETFEQTLEEGISIGAFVLKLVGVGESKADAKMDTSELAAWTQVCRVVLNLQETITAY